MGGGGVWREKVPFSLSALLFFFESFPNSMLEIFLFSEICWCIVLYKSDRPRCVLLLLVALGRQTVVAVEQVRSEAEMNQGQGGAGVGRNLSPSAETCITSNKTSWTRLVLIYFAVGRNIGHHVLVSLSCWPQSCRCQSMLEGWGMLKSRVSRVIVSRVSQFIVGWGDILDLREVNWGVVGVEDNIGVECEVGNIGILVARSNSLMLTFISLVIMRWARVRSLCMILWLWRYSTPETTWSKMFLASGSEKECLVFLILCQFNSLC